MINAREFDRQLKKIGVNFWFLGNAELRELRHILVDGETIEHCILGRYEGGFAVLCATNMRLLLVDKKPFYLTLEDIRYDMVVEVDFGGRLIDAHIVVCTPNKTLRFTALKKVELRSLTVYVQNKVMSYRQQHTFEPQQQHVVMQPVPQPAPQPVPQSAWQPQRFIEPPAVTTHHSIKNIAQTAIDGASRVAETRPITAVRRAINPYARSSLVMRQRISRF